MDEPSAILDEGEIETLFEVVRRLTAEGVGVVYISHRLDEIRRIGDRVTVLTDGRTAATGIPATTPTDELVELMVGRKVEQLYPERPAGTGEVLLEVRGLRRLPEVRGVSLEVRAGEVVGLGGLVGSGRSELLRLIYGIDAPEEGEVLDRGQAAAAEPARPRDRRRPRPGAGGPQVPGPAARLEPDQERQPRRPRPLRPRRCSTSAPSAPRPPSSCAR